jgi:hypothetical protein
MPVFLSMQHRTSTFFIGLTLAATLGGCYATKIQSGTKRAGATHSHRQWFTVAGLVPLSDEAGGECGDGGVSYAESKISITDGLLSAVIGVAGASIGFAACNDSDEKEYASCVSGAATLAGLLVGSRTVNYQCNGAGGTASARLVPLKLEP